MHHLYNVCSELYSKFCWRLLSRFPYYAADVLASNAMILQALIEGGWTTEKEEEEDTDKTADTTATTESSENALVQSILKSNDEQ